MEPRYPDKVFIVTQGAENIKLGDIEVLLVEKQQALEFLQKKQVAIESELALLCRNLF